MAKSAARVSKVATTALKKVGKNASSSQTETITTITRGSRRARSECSQLRAVETKLRNAEAQKLPSAKSRRKRHVLDNPDRATFDHDADGKDAGAAGQTTSITNNPVLLCSFLCCN
jgi:hypothetical protein